MDFIVYFIIVHVVALAVLIRCKSRVWMFSETLIIHIIALNSILEVNSDSIAEVISTCLLATFFLFVSHLRLAVFILRIWFDSKKKDKKDYLSLARGGNVDAQFRLAKMYDKGIDITKNEAEAAKWYRKAAEKGHAEAQLNLAEMLEFGTGVSKNVQEAVEWYRKSAKLGHADAQYILANMYAEGRGVEKDKAEAIKWYQKAADNGNGDAKVVLKSYCVD